MTIADRIRRASALIAVCFCMSLVSAPGAIAAPDEDKTAGAGATGQEKRQGGSGNGAPASSPAPDESTTVAHENGGAPGTSNGKAGDPHGNNKKDPDPATIATPSTSPTTTTTPSSSNGGGNGGGTGKAGGGNTTFDPDPAPVGTPPSTTGPSTCDGDGPQQGGSYDHDNCDGTQGQNGNGGNGKCAGCTGKADDKGPGGQSPRDHNNGYECDHNGGVGKGNPAHSKCTTAPPCQTNCNPGCQTDCDPGCKHNCNPGCQTDCDPGCKQNCNPGCQTDCDPGCPGTDCDEDDDVLGKLIRRAIPIVRSDIVQGPRVRSAALPFTGASSIVPLMSLGLLLVTAGALGVVTTGGRRRVTTR